MFALGKKLVVKYKNNFQKAANSWDITAVSHHVYMYWVGKVEWRRRWIRIWTRNYVRAYMRTNFEFWIIYFNIGFLILVFRFWNLRGKEKKNLGTLRLLAVSQTFTIRIIKSMAAQTSDGVANMCRQVPLGTAECNTFSMCRGGNSNRPNDVLF